LTGNSEVTDAQNSKGREERTPAQAALNTRKPGYPRSTVVVMSFKTEKGDCGFTSVSSTNGVTRLQLLQGLLLARPVQPME
jgi:hypothetical protein